MRDRLHAVLGSEGHCLFSTLTGSGQRLQTGRQPLNASPPVAFTSTYCSINSHTHTHTHTHSNTTLAHVRRTPIRAPDWLPSTLQPAREPPGLSPRETLAINRFAPTACMRCTTSANSLPHAPFRVALGLSVCLHMEPATTTLQQLWNADFSTPLATFCSHHFLTLRGLEAPMDGPVHTCVSLMLLLVLTPAHHSPCHEVPLGNARLHR